MVDPTFMVETSGAGRIARRAVLAGLLVLAATLPSIARADGWRAARAPNDEVSLAPVHRLAPDAEWTAQRLPAAARPETPYYGVERLPPPHVIYQPAATGEVTLASTQAMPASARSAIQLMSLEEPDETPPAPQPPPEDGATPPTPAPAAPGATDAKTTPAPGQEPPKLGQAPVSNTLQFLRAQDVLLDQGAWQFDTGLAYALFDNDVPLPVFDEVTGEMVNVVEGHARLRLLYTPLGVRYGLTDNVQLFGYLPTGWSNTQLSFVGDSEERNKGGIGDLTAGASIHLLKGEAQLPDVIANVGFTAPTGPFDIPLFGLAPGSGLGQGFWALSGQLLFINRYDPIVVFYGAGYRHLFERDLNGVLQAPGEQINYQLGVGFAVNDRVTLSTAFQGFYITNTALEGQTIPGTNLEPISLRFAATIARNCRILEPFVIVGMTDSAPQANCGITLTFY